MHMSREDRPDDLAADVGEAEVAALEPVGEAQVVDAEAVEMVAWRSWTWTGSPTGPR